MSMKPDCGWKRMSGLPAWLMWSTAHRYFLVGFRSRLIVRINWLWNYLTFNRGARLITDGGLAKAAPKTRQLPIASSAPSLSSSG